MSQEIELKLSITADAINNFKAVPVLQGIDSDISALENTYFDTPELALTSQGTALRIRKLPVGYVQTLKSKGHNVGGLHKRDEWEYPIQGPSLDLSLFPAKALPESVDVTMLTPLFKTDFQRTRWMVNFGQSLIELVLDQGVISVGDKTDTISELELELKNGDINDLLELSLEISKSVAIMPSDISKAERGYRLYQDHSDVAVALPNIVPQQSMESAFCALFGYELEKIQRYWQGYWSTGEWKYLNHVLLTLGNLDAQVEWFQDLIPEDQQFYVKAQIHWIEQSLKPILSWWPACFELSQHALEDPANLAISLQQSKAKRALSAITVLQENPLLGHRMLSLTAWLHRREWRQEQTVQQRAKAELAIVDGLDRYLSKAMNAVQMDCFAGSVSNALAQTPAVHRLLMLCRYFDHFYGKELGELRAPLEALEDNLSRLSAMEVMARLKDWINDLPLEEQASVHSWARSKPVLLRDIKQLAGRLFRNADEIEVHA
ncbi:inorganic triphosphatase [Reinekea sp.]|jgi:triphosphatase|uniref:CYTH domain-containing protein n=1 Tax=Reinekea sp. TaxID=1970455 RepID=UPI00398944FD